ncbi:MAG: VTT domain-containing protein [Candidatus Pacebacteria bacterium]|jgi:membrane protein DedA with SNARE-associated domain|nr:VTT domain-containing protein [Candidatus Paceibacterota bacterium]
MFEQSIDVFVHLVQGHRVWGYVVLFIAMMLEGEVLLIVAGMLASLEAFDVGDVFWIALVGVVLGNTMYYQAGVMLKNGKVATRVIHWAEKAITFFLPEFRQKPFKSIFISKFIYGANRATVIMSGVFRIPFKLFFKAEFLASIFWVIVYMSVGYFFGYAAINVTHNASRFVLLALVFVLGFILIQSLVTHRYERNKHKKLEEDNNA